MRSEEQRADLIRGGRWLREQRRKRGFSSAAAFGREVGASKEVVSAWELGRFAIPDNRAEAIAETLGVSVLETRRGLGMWVPPGDDAHAACGAIDDLCLEERFARLVRRIRARGDVAAARELDKALREHEGGA